MVKNNVFAEKYRPKTFDEVVGQEHIIPTLRAFVKNRNLPHMLFSGKAGTGKTTAVKVIARELYGENWRQYFLEINASDDRGIDVVREKIKGYARVKTLGEDFKIIFLDEADAMCLTGDTEIIVGSLENPTIRRLDSMIKGRKVMIPSINPETLELERDKGWLVDSGYTDFLEVTLEDGSTVNASKNHPFFKIENGKLIQIKLEDLSEGDEIVELNNKIYNKCKYCGEYTFNKNCCSTDCQNKYHSLEMSNKGNPMYGKHHTEETKQEISKTLSDGRFAGENNPNYGGTWYGKQFWDTATDEQKKQSIERLTKENSKSYKERFGERALEERIKRNPNASKQRILTNDWIKEQLKGEYIKCQKCGILLKTSGNEKDSVYIHHKDGNHDNHVPENIEFVCPYCHNMKCHNKTQFLEKGWTKLRGVSVHNGVRIKKIENIGKQKAWNISMERNKNFILKNGVVTHNTKDAQQALRRIIEMYSSKCRFALSANFPNKIIDPIKDRCVLFRFRGIKPENMEPMLTEVAEKEQIDITTSAIHVLALLSKGSMRTALNTLDRLKAGGETGIDDSKIYDVMAYVNDDDIRKLLVFIRQGDDASVDECVDDLLNTKVYTPEEILESLWRLIAGSTILSKESKLDALERLGDMEFRISVGSMPFFQIGAFCRRLIRLYDKSVVK